MLCSAVSCVLTNCHICSRTPLSLLTSIRKLSSSAFPSFSLRLPHLNNPICLSTQAKLVKSAVVKVPRSVYAAIPGRNKYRPSQETPIDNLVLAGCWTSQKFLG